MELSEKLTILSDAAKYDASCASSGAQRRRPVNGLGDARRVGVCHSFAPDGRCISLLKLLFTNYCIYDCRYCINRASSPVRRAAFTVDEILTLTVEFYKRNFIEGLFLSSGVMVSPDHTMEKMIETARRLRLERRFGAYIHLKVVPGASPELVREAGRWADRLSANIELSSQEELDHLAPEKTHQDIESSMSQIQRVIGPRQGQGRGKRPQGVLVSGQSTQLIVGATPAPDRMILEKADRLYQRFALNRVYYSAYSPIPHESGDLPSARVPLMREHRLYQADWLMRFYGFRVEELVTQDDQNLSLQQDPKLSWALAHPECFPVDVNTAPREMLWRVPGIGVRNAMRIAGIRRYHPLRLGDLKKLRVAVKRARDFIITADSMPMMGPGRLMESDTPRKTGETQLELFEAPVAAVTGEF